MYTIHLPSRSTTTIISIGYFVPKEKTATIQHILRFEEQCVECWIYVTSASTIFFLKNVAFFPFLIFHYSKMIFISLLATKDTKISSVWSAFSLNFWCGITAFWAVILTHAAQFQKPADEDTTVSHRSHSICHRFHSQNRPSFYTFTCNKWKLHKQLFTQWSKFLFLPFILSFSFSCKVTSI